jgi:hypothetical protein
MGWDAAARHAAQTGIAVVFGGLGERVGDIGPAGRDFPEGVDRAGPDVGVGMVQEVQRSRYEQLLARPARVLLALIAGERVQGALQDLRVLVVQGGNEIDKGGFVSKVIKDRRAQSPDNRLRVMHPAPHRGDGRLARLPQEDLGSLAPFRVGELRDPPVEIGAGGKATHRSSTVRTRHLRIQRISRTRLRGSRWHAPV